MAKGNSSNAGCGALFLVFLPFYWVYDKCSGGDEERARDRIAAETREANERQRRLTDARREVEAENAKKAALAKAAADLRIQQTAALASWKPVQRVQALQQCFKDDCPDGVPDSNALLEAAKTEPERNQLRALKGQLEKAQARAEKAAERASAALKCCDGSLSPSCTCGGGRRGCCSRHGGVCGCSADD